MIKKFFSALVVVLFATSMVAQTGLTCEDPIPVDKSYAAHVEAGSELWYTAYTYDLPLHVYFSPDSMNSEWSPEVVVDFTCEEGVYNDHKLDSVINILSALGVDLPVEFLCTEVGRNGKTEWELSIDERYRDQLTEYGLTHNVQAFVKVYFPESGSISLTPDTAFQSCLENGYYAQLGDTISVAANDTNNMIVLPFSEWKNDSLRIVWTGEEPACVWVAEDDCWFVPTDINVDVKAKYNIDKNTPKVLYPADMQSAIDNWIGKGIFYAKVLSNAPGQLVVERIPLGEIQGDAILLKHGETVQLQANDDRVFCFPKTWKSTELLANTQYNMTMYVSNTVDFEVGDANVIAKYPFSKENSGRLLQLAKGDIDNLVTSAVDDYMYVRFVCNEATELTPSLWNVSSCVENSILIVSGEPFARPTSNKVAYRMAYKDWADNDFDVTWDSKRGGLSAYVGSYCDFVTTDPNRLGVISVTAGQTKTVTADVVNAWGLSLDDEGFVYLRFSASRTGTITFTTTKPVEEDPVPVTNPCIESSTKLNVGDQLTLNLNSAFTVYCINYAEWAAQGVKLQWTGAEPLHTFVAETCEYALAPYNRYVHAYLPITTETVLDMDALAPYVDAEGYLYVRFLTEKEGVLTAVAE